MNRTCINAPFIHLDLNVTMPVKTEPILVSMISTGKKHWIIKLFRNQAFSDIHLTLIKQKLVRYF